MADLALWLEDVVSLFAGPTLAVTRSTAVVAVYCTLGFPTNGLLFLPAFTSTVFRNHGQLRQLCRRDADALEALGDDAVRRRQQTDEQVHRRDLAAAMVARAIVGLAQQADHVI